MSSTYSGLKIQLMATGENAGTWGDITNTNLGTAIEEAVAGTADVTFDNDNVTLTLTDTNTTQVARHLRLNLIGTTGAARELIVPNVEKSYIVNNTCAHDVTVKTSAGTGVAVPTGKSMILYNDGTNVSVAVDFVPGGTETADRWTTARTVTIGSTGKSVDGSANVAWNLNEIGAQATLVSGTNIKTINGNSILGGGNLEISGGGGTGTVTAVTATSPLASSGGTAPNITLNTVPVSKGGTGGTTTTAARSNLGLGSMATQNSNNVTITGGSIDGDVIDDGPIRIDNGSQSSPAYSFSSDTDMGMFREIATGGPYLSFAANGGLALRLSGGSNPTAAMEGGTFNSKNPTFVGFEYEKIDTTAGTTAFQFTRSTGFVGSITTTTSSTAYNTTSDYRLKENLTPLTGAVDRLKNIPVYRFNFIANPELTVDGFVAHEVQEFVPEAVVGEKDAMRDGKIDPQGIDQAKLVPLLAAAVKELTARVEQLEAQLNSP